MAEIPGDEPCRIGGRRALHVKYGVHPAKAGKPYKCIPQRRKPCQKPTSCDSDPEGTTYTPVQGMMANVCAGTKPHHAGGRSLQRFPPAPIGRQGQGLRPTARFLTASVAGEDSQPLPAASWLHGHTLFCRLPRFHRMNHWGFAYMLQLLREVYTWH